MTHSVEYWALLTATLLHDVPWKPWVVRGAAPRLLRDRLDEGARRLFERLEKSVEVACEEHGVKLKGNDREALALIAWIAARLREHGAGEAADVLLSVAEGEWCNAIHEADVIASSIDRLVQPAREAKKVVNIFNPSIERHAVVPEVKEKKLGELLEKFLERLRGIISAVVHSCSGVSGAERAECILKRLYLALYALLEPIWYRASREALGYQFTPVADTRVPHHTVFDHCRAAATALALRRRSIYALVDIPGIHAFVAAARKTRDFWAGSWLLSLLSWSTVKPVIEEYGPQAVLLPSLQLNPFYIDMLLEHIPELEDQIPAIAWRDGWPSQPLMPATVSLILDADSLDCERLRGKLEESLKSAWRRLWGELREMLEGVRRGLGEGRLPDWCEASKLGEESSNVYEALARLLCVYALDASGGDREKLREALEALIEYMLEAMDEPPLGVRVTCVEVDYTSDRYRRFVESIIATLSRIRVKVGDEWVDAPRLVEEVVREAAGRSVRIETILDRALRYLYMRVKLDDRSLDTPNTTPSYSVGVAGAAEKLWETARRVSRRIYRYCSVCGRLPAAARFPRIGDRLPGYGQIDDDAFAKLQRATHYLADEGEALCPYCLLKRLVGREPRVASRLVKSAAKAARRPVASTRLAANAWNGELLETLREMGYEPSDVSDSMVDRLIDTACRGGGRPEWCRRLYNHVAMIYGDGDQMGKGYLMGVLIRADIGWSVEAVELLEEHPLVKSLASRLDAPEPLRMEALPPLLYYALLYRDAGAAGEKAALAAAALTAAVSSMLRSMGQLGVGDWPLTLIPTPSYLRTLSTSLMVASLVDAAIVRALRGVLVYAGGDDVVALLPVAADDTSLVYQALADELASLMGGDAKAIAEELREKLGVDGGDQLPVNVAWLGVMATRLNYWGLLGREPGFHVYVDIVAPAVAAHGRSYGVNIVHYRTPLWQMYSDAFNLMEEKDMLKVVKVKSCGRGAALGVFEPRGVSKDAVIVGYEGGEAARVPFYARSLREKLRGELGVDGARLASLLYSWVATRGYTRSILYDVERYRGLFERLSTKLPSCHALETMEKLLRSVYERNRGRGVDEQTLRQWIGLAASTLLATRPEALEVFQAVRHLAGGARR